MAESNRHTRLVQALFDYVVRVYSGGDDGSVFIDDGTPRRRPPIIAGHVPDVYVPPMNSERMIIGEAETARSLESPCTLNQIGCLLQACELTNKSIFILAVPWDRVRLSASIIAHLRVNYDAPTATAVVLEKLAC